MCHFTKKTQLKYCYGAIGGWEDFAPSTLAALLVTTLFGRR